MVLRRRNQSAEFGTFWDLLGHRLVVVREESGFVLRRRARMWRPVAPCGAVRGGAGWWVGSACLAGGGGDEPTTALL